MCLPAPHQSHTHSPGAGQRQTVRFPVWVILSSALTQRLLTLWLYPSSLFSVRGGLKQICSSLEMLLTPWGITGFSTHCCATIITICIQAISSPQNESLYPLNDSHSPLHPDPGVHYSTSCLCQFNSSGYLMKVESCNICPFVFG